MPFDIFHHDISIIMDKEKNLKFLDAKFMVIVGGGSPSRKDFI